MIIDYRNTQYCQNLDDIRNRKAAVETTIKEQHRRAKDMHRYVSENGSVYKTQFIEAYNGKCAYCGMSIDIAPKEFFEIDHYIFKESAKFHTKKDAGYMDNLVLACHTCNHRKSDFEITDKNYKKLYPDGKEITNTFFRDSDYYIRVSSAEKTNSEVLAFYEQLGFGDELRRLDYLLLSIYGFEESIKDKNGMAEVYRKIDSMAALLRKKRNVI